MEMEKKKEENKESKLQKIKNWYIKHKKTIFIVIGILFLLIAGIGFYDNLYLWFWSDFFLSLLFLLLWLCFFPFSYSLQKKYLGKSVFTADLFTVIMFLIFIFSSFSLLMSIFQRDLTINLRSIIYLLIILLWRSFVLPITAKKWKKYVWKNILARRKRIFVFFIAFSVVIFFVELFSFFNSADDYYLGWNETQSLSTNETHSKQCFASKQKLRNDNNIDVYFTQLNHEWKIDQKTFDVDNMENMEYYIEWKSTDKKYYFNWEICNTDKNEVVLSIMYDGWMLVDEIYPGADWWFVGNSSSFKNLEFERWNYAINVFVSNDDSSWKFVKTLSFDVEK